ncbi:hypothetical protein BTJ39_22255 [Izhakiella australiensis]|uniref:Bacteriophage protein n=1 Tax=Izhakiella australiensis TaxID=1926881 RepID=A0A1S8Y905_9GAMM|nr:hypothetical protein [Izhakiella australiensis]OON35601.1 hypothetical protein BTJ39_22255 [Izhakiella australiensis]
MEFEINGNTYRASKLSVFDQLKVSRKLLPLMAGMMADFNGVRDVSQGGNIYEALEKVLPKVADALADMSDEDTRAIINPCLSVVARQNGNVWSPVFTSGELMFDDINLMHMLQIVGRVVGDSLGNFLPAPPDSGTVGHPPAA